MIFHRLTYALFGLGLAVFLFGAQPASAQDCTNPSGNIGDIIYNNNYDVIQGCTSEVNWMAFHEPQCPDGDACEPCNPANSPSPGTSCNDGTYFIGDIGAGPVYATNETFESLETWNDGNTNYSTTGATSTTDGEGNTATLVTADSDDGVAGTQAHDAAIYCDDLSAHGHGDWYLPAEDELDLFWNGGSPVANVDESGSFPDATYWSSTEASHDRARRQEFDSGSKNSGTKNGGLAVRCVRR